MGDVLAFNRLKIGEILTLEVKEEKIKCEVLTHEGNDLYKFRLLEGEHRGKFCYFQLEGFEDEQ